MDLLILFLSLSMQEKHRRSAARIQDLQSQLQGLQKNQKKEETAEDENHNLAQQHVRSVCRYCVGSPSAVQKRNQISGVTLSLVC